jgi:hypothetical protein
MNTLIVAALATVTFAAAPAYMKKDGEFDPANLPEDCKYVSEEKYNKMASGGSGAMVELNKCASACMGLTIPTEEEKKDAEFMKAW